MAETAQLTVQLDLKGNLTSGITKAQRQLGGLGTSVARTGKGIGQLGAGFARAGLVVGGAAVTGLVAAAKAGIDYEDAFAGVRKTVEATEPELAALSRAFRDMATEIPITAVEFARLGETAGALGIATDAIDEFTRTTALLGVTTNLTADEAADALGRIGNVLKLTADDYDNFGSALVNLGNKGASTEAEIIEITKRFAAAGKQAGLSTPDILGLAEAAASFTGLAPEAAGSSLSRFLTNMTKHTAAGGKALKLISKVAGTDFRKAFDKDAGGALLRFIGGLDKLDKYEKAKVLDTLGLDSVYLSQLLKGLSQNVDGVTKSLDNAEEGWKGNFLNKEAEEKFKTLASQLKILKGNLVEAGLTLSDGFLPALNRSTQKLIAFLKVPGNRAELTALGKDIGAAIDDIDWDKVLDGARSFVGVLKSTLSITLSILEAINKLPNEVKAAAAALLVLNKASGGLIGAGVGNIAGGIAETAVRGLGSRIPKVGALFAQPVFVTNWPLGGLGGGLPAGGGAAAAGIGLRALLAGTAAAGVVLLLQEASKEAAKGFNAEFSKIDIDAKFQGAQFGPQGIIPGLQNIAEVIRVAGELLNKPPPAPVIPKSTTPIPVRMVGDQPDRTDPDKIRWRNEKRDKAATAVENLKRDIGPSLSKTPIKLDIVKTSVIEAGLAAKNAGIETKAAAAAAGVASALAAKNAGTTTSGAVRLVAPPIVGAIGRIPRPLTTVTVNVTATHVTKSTTVQNRYGPGGGSGSVNSRPPGTGPLP